MSEKPPLQSHHIFILPIKWHSYNDKRLFAEQKELSALLKLIGNAPSFSGGHRLQWQRFSFNWEQCYNEAIYFHPYAREILFDTGNAQCGSVLQYHIKKEGMRYEITTTQREYPFILEIEELTLNFYENGIAILAFHLNNLNYNNPDDILLINDFGRRIFPQFLDMPHEENNRLYGVKGAFLANKIEVFDGNNNISSDNFENLVKSLKDRPSDLSADFLLPDFVTKLLPEKLSDPKVYRCTPLLDDRMHVVCWVGNKEWNANLEFDHIQLSAMRWYSLIFVDGKINEGVKNHSKMLEMIPKHTYRRWAEEGLFYGVCRYAFVVLGDGDKWFHQNIILKHVQTIYFHLALISLVQRGYIIQFSEEIARLSQKVAQNHKVNRHSEEVRALYSQYLHFINKVYFREVTPQEQGIELYKMIQDNMEIERDVKALQVEINEFSRVLDLEAGDRQSDALNTLTIVGAGLLIPALILAYYGVSAWPEGAKDTNITEANTAFFSTGIPLTTGMGMLIGFVLAWLWVKTRTSHFMVRFLIALFSLLSLSILFYFVTHVLDYWKN